MGVDDTDISVPPHWFFDRNAIVGRNYLPTRATTGSAHEAGTYSSVLEMIAASAKQLKEAPAVLCGGRVLSYGKLLSLAQKNADRLLREGVKKGDFVLCGLATGVDLPVAWLATMMAEAVLVPIDLQWPVTRLNSVLETTKARVAIIPPGTNSLSALNLGRLLLVEIESKGIEGDVVVSTPDLSAHDLLYGFFTSGSTGTPKCALNHHAGLMNRFSYMTRRFGEGHRVYQNSAPLFDSSIWQLLWPLTSSGVSVLPANRDRWSLEAVVDVVEHQKITMTDFVPTLFKALVRSMQHGFVPAAKLQSLKYVLIGGEAIDPVSVHAFRRYLPDARIINTYGHTEASIGMVFHEVCDEDGDDIPLGAPIDNTFVRIVDENLRELPHGSLGEIVVAGICVGAGYLNAPLLTQKVFVSNPFGDLPGATVYRTGDFGKVRSDGLLEFAGRIDDQVKVRGVRIELTEVSIAMREVFPSIEDVCPVVVTAPLGEQTLAVAYAAREPLASLILRQKLSTVLPTSHLPQFFLHVSKIPVSVNGKTDRTEVTRQILQALEHSPSDGETCTTLELILQSYRDILGISDVDPWTHFFDYGGDSLRAVHLSFALQSRLGHNIPASMIYLHPTPIRLHGALMGAATTEVQSPRLPEIGFNNAASPRQHSRHVLLTGATGFVGVHILERLLSDTDLEIILLIRDKKGVGPRERLEASFRAAFPAQVLPEERISVLSGDLSRPSLAVPASEWSWLSRNVDEVIHCGAEVNFLAGPASLFDANVGGTAELIRLCNEGQAKRLHHISSLAVGRVENDEQAGSKSSGQNVETASGYVYTKYLADQLVHLAQQQGLMARIYRLDDILPALGSGYPNKRSLIHLFLKACLRYEIVVNQSGSVGLLPVDMFAGWLCNFVGGAERFSRLPNSVDVMAVRHVEFEELVRFVARGIGRSLDTVGYSSFLARLTVDHDDEGALLRGMLPGPGDSHVVFRETPPRSTARSALALFPWGTNLSVALADFTPFVQHVGRSMNISSGVIS